MGIKLQKSKPFQATRRLRRGAALIEFALVVGILLAIVMGIIEFSIYGKNSLAIANSTREGARTAALGRTVEQIRSRVKETALPQTVPDENITLTYSRLGGNYITLTNRPPATAGGATTENIAGPDDLIRVEVQVQNKTITGAFGTMFNRTIRSAVTMRRERITN